MKNDVRNLKRDADALLQQELLDDDVRQFVRDAMKAVGHLQAERELRAQTYIKLRAMEKMTLGEEALYDESAAIRKAIEELQGVIRSFQKHADEHGSEDE